MYNTYTYDFSNERKTLNNLNIEDCFEKIETETENINDILNKINLNFIQNNKDRQAATSSTSSISKYSRSKPTYTRTSYTKSSKY